MKTVFVDTAYWIAAIRPRDPWKEAATNARRQLGRVRLVTTDEVLTEFLAALSRSRPALRLGAARIVRTILANPNVRVVPQSRESFQRGLERYEARSDKAYSLQDCVSMNVMEAESITDILTNDRHFAQEGFNILMKMR